MKKLLPPSPGTSIVLVQDPDRLPSRRASELANPLTSRSVASLDELAGDMREIDESPGQENTEKAYRSDWSHFEKWCVRLKLISLPADPSTVAAYITALSKGKADDRGPRKTATIRRRLVTIGVEHRLKDMEDPTKHARVKYFWKKIRTELGILSVGKDALLRDDVRRCAASEPDTLVGIRNRVFLLWGLESAERRSEIIVMRLEDMEFSERGIRYQFKKSKTNQEGKLEWIGVERQDDVRFCPVAAMEKWISEAGITSGFVFPSEYKKGKPMNSRIVARVVKAAVAREGIDGDFSAHSMRSGYVTSETADGAGDSAIRAMTRHKSSAMLDVYRKKQAMDDWSKSEPTRSR